MINRGKTFISDLIKKIVKIFQVQKSPHNNISFAIK
jgi:hypothetical protein